MRIDTPGMGIGLLLAWAGLARAETALLTVDPAQSFIIVDATLMTSGGDDSDSDASPLSGTIEIELDDFGIPLELRLFDFAVNADETLDLAFDFGFFGDADATIVDGGATYATPGVPTTFAVDSAGAFGPEDVLTQLEGLADASYDFFLIGSDSTMIDLSESEPTLAPFEGEVSVSGGVITLTSSVSFSLTETVVDGVADIVLDVTIELVATGEVPACPADFNADGAVNVLDFVAFQAAFNAGDPAADCDADGALSVLDFLCFQGAFQAGCP